MDSLRPGDPQWVGKYRLLGRLGEGGMGVVFLGRSPGGRSVAVKRVHANLAGDPDFRRRFAGELAAARRVGGFHTAQVIDADPGGDPPWMVTAYIPGPTLAEVLDTHGPLPEPSLRVLGAGLAEALEAIHRAGLVHRDLKPSNIVLAQDGPRVIDFGIARALDATGFTSTNVLVGTPSFMAPEQVQSKGVIGPASDVFCLGQVLCRAAGGEPFGTGAPQALLYRVVHEDADVSAVPPGLRPIVAGCLAKNPAHRPTPAALLDAFGVADSVAAWLPSAVQTLVIERTEVAVHPAAAQMASIDRPFVPPGGPGAERAILPGPFAANGLFTADAPPLVPKPVGVPTTPRTRTVVVSIAAALCLIASVAAGTYFLSVAGQSTAGHHNLSNSNPTNTVAADFALTGVVNPSTRKGGTLVLGGANDLDSTDPVDQYYAYSWNFERLYGRTVMTYATGAPGAASTKLVPDLATAPGVMSADGKIWTYHIRPGLRFSTGEPITSKNVKYAIERSYAIDSVNKDGPRYFSTVLADGTYPGPYTDAAPDHLGLTSIATPDDTTIVFHLTAAYADFPYLMTLPQTSPVPIDADQNPATGGVKYAGTAVAASGPYMITKYDKGTALELSRNPSWDPATDPVRKALPDAISMKTNWDATQLDQAILSGSVAADYDGGGIQQATLGQVLADPAKRALSDNPTTDTTRYISIDQEVAPFDNVHCRRAVAYALNKVELVAARGGPVAGAKIGNSLLPPGVPGHTNADAYPTGAQSTGDITKGKQELAACGKPDGFATAIVASNRGKAPVFAAALQNALHRVGISASIDQVDSGTYYGDTLGRPDVMKSHGYGLAEAAWGPDWPDGYGFFSQITDGRALTSTNSGANYGRLDDPVINSLLDRMRSAPNADSVAITATQIDNQAMSDAVYIPFGYESLMSVRAPHVANYYITNAFSGQPDLVALGANA